MFCRIIIFTVRFPHYCLQSPQKCHPFCSGQTPVLAFRSISRARVAAASRWAAQTFESQTGRPETFLAPSSCVCVCVFLSVRRRPRPVLWPHEAVWSGGVAQQHTLSLPGRLRGSGILQYRGECLFSSPRPSGWVSWRFPDVGPISRPADAAARLFGFVGSECVRFRWERSTQLALLSHVGFSLVRWDWKDSCWAALMLSRPPNKRLF